MWGLAQPPSKLNFVLDKIHELRSKYEFLKDDTFFKVWRMNPKSGEYEEFSMLIRLTSEDVTIDVSSTVFKVVNTTGIALSVQLITLLSVLMIVIFVLFVSKVNSDSPRKEEKKVAIDQPVDIPAKDENV